MTFWNEIVKIYGIEAGYDVHAFYDEENDNVIIHMPGIAPGKNRDTSELKDEQYVIGKLEKYLKINKITLYEKFRRTYRDAKAQPRFQKVMSRLLNSHRVTQDDYDYIYYKYVE